MNNTKWEELRLGMYGLGALTPRWRRKDTETGYICEWDREWFHHFRLADYDTIEWIEIMIETNEQKNAVENVLREHHLPVEHSGAGYKIHGYAADTSTLTYIK